MGPTPQVDRGILTVLNQLYEIEQKLKRHGDPHNLLRNVGKARDAFAALESGGGLIYEDPLGQRLDETRTDLEVSIAGTSTEKLVVVQVVKPIIRAIVGTFPAQASIVVQKGIVVAEVSHEEEPA